MNTELDLIQILLALKKRIWLIAVVTLVFGAAGYLLSVFCITPMYSATASMYVYNEKSRTDTITSSDLTTSQKLVETYIVVLSSNSVLDEVSNQLGGIYSASEIRNMLSAASINNTEAFKITIKNSNPSIAQKIANTIADVAPAEIIRVVKAGSVEIIDYADFPASPSSPDINKNTAVSALIGLVLTCGICVLMTMFDTVVRSEDDIENAFDIPILGVIPNMNEAQDKEGYHHERA